MVRYTFGGDIHDLIARPDANAGGALKLAPNLVIPFYTAASGGTVVTDFLVDTNGDGTFATSDTQVKTRATGYLPDFKGPDGFDTLYYDPDPNDTDVIRVRLVARDSTTAGAQAASTTAAGLVEYADATELATGTATNRVTSVADVTSKINAHVAATDPHPVYGDAIDNVLSTLTGKANLVGTDTPVVPLDELPVSTTGTASTVVGYRSNGNVGVTDAATDDAAVSRAQALSLIKSSTALAGTDVRSLVYAPASSPASSASNTTYTTIPTIAVTDAASGQEWEVDYRITYRATTAAGIQVRHKTAAASPTNLIADPTFSLGVSEFPAFNTAAGTPTRNTTQGGQDGSDNMQVSTNGTSVAPLVCSKWFPYTSGQAYSAGVYMKRSSATGRGVRIDIQFGDSTATDTAVSTGVIAGIGQNSTPVTSTTAFQQVKVENVSTTDAAAVKVRARLAVQASSTGDVHHFDAVQLEPGATTLPAFGSTGGSGAGSMDVLGDWFGLTNAATTSDNYSKVTAVRTASGGSLGTSQGGLGSTTDAVVSGSFRVKIGGTGLTNQRIELEFAQRVQDTTTGNATTVVAARATFARIV